MGQEQQSRRLFDVELNGKGEGGRIEGKQGKAAFGASADRDEKEGFLGGTLRSDAFDLCDLWVRREGAWIGSRDTEQAEAESRGLADAKQRDRDGLKVAFSHTICEQRDLELTTPRRCLNEDILIVLKIQSDLDGE